MSNLALNDALNMFADDLKKKGKSVNTIVAYKGDINQLFAFLSAKGISDIYAINPENINDFKEDLAKNEYTAKSISRKLNSIKNFFSFLKN